jgi:uncharacterized membrane protein YkvA (DUF1232 family)
MRIVERIRAWAHAIRRDALTLWFACRDPRTPWGVKALCAFVVAYALSPIDLVPDFIPVLGYLDEALLLPGLIWLALRLLPEAVVVACRARAEDWLEGGRGKPISRIGAGLVVLLWGLAAYGLWVVWRTP